MHARLHLRYTPMSLAPDVSARAVPSHPWRGALACLALGAVLLSSHGALAQAQATGPQGAGPAVAAQGASASVGEVSLVLGQARATGADGRARHLQRGSAVFIGDRVETPAGSHVHVSFVDGGKLSVRPSSRLLIEDYSQPTAAKPGSIRLRLEEGVVRSITGAWGEAAKDRFRLNTPLAAIGVRGTDFAVRSEGEKTAASVYTGAIVVARLDEGCAATVGPCANGSEKLLTAGMKGQMLELARFQSAPQFVPAVDLLAVGSRAVLAENPSRAEALAAGSTMQRQDAGSTASANGSNANTAAGAASPNAQAKADILANSRPITEALAATAARQASDAAPPVVVQLSWARLNEALPGDALSQTFEQAYAAGRRSTVGNFTYTLMTLAPPVSPGATIAAGEASANFRLAGASATLLNSQGVALEPVTVKGGTLGIDFARSLVNTYLSLASPLIGQDSISATAALTSAGFFYSPSSNQLVVGTVTPDGREAGYFFEKRVTPGVIKGITLWGR